MLCVIEGYMLAGRHPEALAIVRQAIDLARGRCERGSEARVHWLLAELTSGPKTFDMQLAEESYGKALNVAQDLGMRPIVAHCHFGLGRLHGHARNCEQGQEHLTIAMTMYREMDMRHWLQKPEAAVS